MNEIQKFIEQLIRASVVVFWDSVHQHREEFNDPIKFNQLVLAASVLRK